MPYASWGRRLTYRTCRNVAAIAVARKLVTYVWYLMNGHFTPLNALSPSQKSKRQKLAPAIGTAKRRAMGYPTIKAFIAEKESGYWQKLDKPHACVSVVENGSIRIRSTSYGRDYPFDIPATLWQTAPTTCLISSK